MTSKPGILTGLAVLVLVMGVHLTTAAAACTFTTVGSTMTLDNDCTTDATILIPNGMTLDGNSHTITAEDPGAGRFHGAVVKNDGMEAHVTNLTITTSLLDGSVCDTAADRLRGILFKSANGTIKYNTVLNINQGAGNACQEGNAIEVSNAPYDGTHPGTKMVEVAHNTISGYQKTGVVANGDVFVDVHNNTITGPGLTSGVPHHGTQVGYGALGSVVENMYAANMYTQPEVCSSAGVLLFRAGDNVLMQSNQIADSDIGFWIDGVSHATMSMNKVLNSGIGYALDDQPAKGKWTVNPVAHTTLQHNCALDNQVGYGLFGSQTTFTTTALNFATGNMAAGLFLGFETTSNTTSQNWALANSGDGISVDAEPGNTFDSNFARGNSALDIRDVGLAGSNTYTNNRCDNFAGIAVDCLSTTGGDCNVNLDGQIDINDILLLLAGRGAPACGADDPRDPDGNGEINVLDARQCVLLCTNPRCAI